VREKVPSISLATVYNCLETLTDCGLAKTVTDERGPARYCPNLAEHAHFFCENCGEVSDIPLRNRRQAEDVWDFPKAIAISRHEVSFRGLCPKCSAAASAKTRAAKRN
jgi:Fur family peroxide stress response transcriptional regulator